jgi:uncharacterized protein YjbI with pentapeptide repeats
VSAVAGIESFLREKDATYRLQLFDLLRGVLTVGHDETSDRVIARTFIKVLKQCMREIREHEAIAGGATIDLQDVWIPSVDAGGLDLSGIEGSGICLNRASIDGTKFDGSTLAGARLSRVTGNSGTSFRNVVMPGVTLQSASLAGVDIEGARLVPPRRSGLEPATADLADADLRGARLVDARLDRARLISVDFERAILTGASLKGAQLQQADFRHADLTGNTRLHGANVANADFRGARLGETARTSLVATNWSRAVLDAETLAWLEAHK